MGKITQHSDGRALLVLALIGWGLAGLFYWRMEWTPERTAYLEDEVESLERQRENGRIIYDELASGLEELTIRAGHYRRELEKQKDTTDMYRALCGGSK